MQRQNASRPLAFAVLCVAGGLLLSASSCVTPEPRPVPGQALTWEQQHYLDMKEYQRLHEDRRQDDRQRPCHLRSCT